MLAEWSVECAAEDPVLVVPWENGEGGAGFVDLRENPYDFESIPEAEQYPALMQALRALNATRSAVFTAKCDAWRMDSDEVKALQQNLDDDSSEVPCGFASYIDVVSRERSLFTSFPRHEHLLARLVRMAAMLDAPMAALDCVVRPALIELNGTQQGYAISLYVKALGIDDQDALREWSMALEAVVALLRGKDFFR